MRRKLLRRVGPEVDATIRFRVGTVPIRDYANAMSALIQPIVPTAAAAFLDYSLLSMHLSRLEIEALRTGQPLASDNKRQNAEWEEKKKWLGLGEPWQ